MQKTSRQNKNKKKQHFSMQNINRIKEEYLAMPVYDEAGEEEENEDSDRLAIVVSSEPSRLKYVTLIPIKKKGKIR